MAKQNGLIHRIVAVLTEKGPMIASDIAIELGLETRKVSNAIEGTKTSLKVNIYQKPYDQGAAPNVKIYSVKPFPKEVRDNIVQPYRREWRELTPDAYDLNSHRNLAMLTRG